MASIIAIIISLFSLIISIIGLIFNKIKKPIILEARDIIIDNTFDLLFETDGHSNNEVTAKIVNFNNQDVLIYLYEGIIPVKNNERSVVELYQVKPTYYTLKANSITNVAIIIDIGKLNNKFHNRYTYLKFEYHNGFRKCKINYCKKGD